MSDTPRGPLLIDRNAVIERLAAMIRDEAYPEFSLAPPPEWARRAAARVIDYHQPMLRDHLLGEAVAIERARITAEVEALPYHFVEGQYRANVLAIVTPP